MSGWADQDIGGVTETAEWRHARDELRILVNEGKNTERMAFRRGEILDAIEELPFALRESLGARLLKELLTNRDNGELAEEIVRMQKEGAHGYKLDGRSTELAEQWKKDCNLPPEEGPSGMDRLVSRRHFLSGVAGVGFAFMASVYGLDVVTNPERGFSNGSAEKAAGYGAAWGGNKAITKHYTHRQMTRGCTEALVKFLNSCAHEHLKPKEKPEEEKTKHYIAPDAKLVRELAHFLPGTEERNAKIREWIDNVVDQGNLPDCSHMSLEGADLQGMKLQNVRFGGANLEGAKFKGSKLSGAMFSPETKLDMHTSFLTAEGLNVNPEDPNSLFWVKGYSPVMHSPSVSGPDSADRIVFQHYYKEGRINPRTSRAEDGPTHNALLAELSPGARHKLQSFEQRRLEGMPSTGYAGEHANAVSTQSMLR